MLSHDLVQKIEKFVSIEPRSVHEIATYLDKNWRTVDRYIKQIEDEFATITTKTFRGGTRGALKIVYSNSFEKISSTKFQEDLEKKLLELRRKEDFSAFDIFQFVSETHKRAIVEHEISESSTNLIELAELLKNTKKELQVFSGNLSWINLKKGSIDLFALIEELVKQGKQIKILCRVDLAGIHNIEKVLNLNYKYGKELIEIRHREQPLRAFVVDKTVFRMKEIKEPTGKIKELDKTIFIFYTIRDKEWTEWLSKLFTRLFVNSVDAKKRLDELHKLLIRL